MSMNVPTGSSSGCGCQKQQRHAQMREALAQVGKTPDDVKNEMQTSGLDFKTQAQNDIDGQSTTGSTATSSVTGSTNAGSVAGSTFSATA